MRTHVHASSTPPDTLIHVGFTSALFLLMHVGQFTFHFTWPNYFVYFHLPSYSCIYQVVSTAAVMYSSRTHSSPTRPKFFLSYNIGTKTMGPYSRDVAIRDNHNLGGGSELGCWSYSNWVNIYTFKRENLNVSKEYARYHGARDRSILDRSKPRQFYRLRATPPRTCAHTGLGFEYSLTRLGVHLGRN